MEDMERYGDYNDTDDGEEKPTALGIVFKCIVFAVVALVVGVLGFRVFLFNSYPEPMQKLYLTDTVAKYLASVDGGGVVKTQSNGTKYDDAKEGNFFFEYLMIIPDADHLQVSIRYNTSLIEKLNEEYGLELSPDANPEELFDFYLAKTKDGYVEPEGSTAPVPTEKLGTLTMVESDSMLMYRYARLAFDDVDLRIGEDGAVGWVRLEVVVKALADNPEFESYKLPVYIAEYPLIDYTPVTSEVSK